MLSGPSGVTRRVSVVFAHRHLSSEGQAPLTVSSKATLAEEQQGRFWFQPAGACWISTGLNYSGHIFFPWHLPSNNKSTDVVVLICLYHDICRHFTCLCLQTQPRNGLIVWALTCALRLCRAVSPTTGAGAQAPFTSCWCNSMPPTPLQLSPFLFFGGGWGEVFFSILFSVLVCMSKNARKEPVPKIYIYLEMVG